MRERKIKRGGIYYAQLSEKNNDKNDHLMHGKRPCVVISNEINNRFSPVVQVVFLSTKINKKHPCHVKVQGKRKSIALCEQISSIPKLKLENKIGQVTEKEIEQINNAVKLQLQLDV